MAKEKQIAWSIRRLFTYGIEKITGYERTPEGYAKSFCGKEDTEKIDRTKDFRTGEYYLSYADARDAAIAKTNKSIEELEQTIAERRVLSFPVEQPD